MGAETIVYPPTPNTSIISADDDPMNPTPIIGNPDQYTPQILPRRHHPIQLCQHVQPIPDTPQSPTPEDRGQSDDFYPDNIPLHNPPNIVAVADDLRNLLLHPHTHRNEVVTSCLVCGKSYDQVIEKLLQTTSIRHHNRVRQCGNDKSREMHSSMAFRAESSFLSPRECRRLPPVTA